MKVRVLFFALARDLAERDVVELSIAEGTTVGELRAILVREIPSLVEVLPNSMMAINQQYARDTDSIPDSAEVACIPPVSGG
jgi:molybdopterin converting factor subunit 1